MFLKQARNRVRLHAACLLPLQPLACARQDGIIGSRTACRNERQRGRTLEENDEIA